MILLSPWLCGSSVVNMSCSTREFGKCVKTQLQLVCSNYGSREFITILLLIKRGFLIWTHAACEGPVRGAGEERASAPGASQDPHGTQPCRGLWAQPSISSKKNALEHPLVLRWRSEEGLLWQRSRAAVVLRVLSPHGLSAFRLCSTGERLLYSQVSSWWGVKTVIV